MFLISKLLWIAAQPLSLVFLGGLLALLAGLLRWRRLALGFAGLSLALLFVTLYTSSGAVALQILEARVEKPSIDPHDPACAIVLGGAFPSDVNTARGGMELNQSADRMVETLRLALEYPDMNILVSGGDGSIGGAFEGDAVTAARFFAAFGLASERLVREEASRNTQENVANSKVLLEEQGLRNCLLVTSAYHMPRSLALMNKAGITVTPWPVDYRTTGEERLRLDFTQPTLNAQLTATALREWLGLFVYHLTGRI